MNARSFINNVAIAWRSRGGTLHFLKRLLWNYSQSLPHFVRKEFHIRFRYPAPLGELVLVVRANQGADNFIHSEVFEHQYYRLPLPVPPETILDLGANAGYTAIYFARVFPSSAIACVEPMPDNLRVLKENLVLNDVRATVFPAAVDTSDGEVTMQVAARDFGHKILESDHGQSDVVRVRSVSIPTIMNELGWPKIDLLKIDIEGHERILLSDAAWLRDVRNICVEWHDESAERDLGPIARQYGFNAPVCRSGLWFMSRARGVTT